MANNSSEERRELLGRAVDRAVTVAGKGRSGAGGTRSEATAREYAQIWTAADAWRVANGRPMPWTSETLAEWAAVLLGEGRAPATVRKWLSAVKAHHRLAGEPVPDDTAAWFVLRVAQDTAEPPAGECATLPDRHAVAAMVATCDPDTNAGRRDRCLITLVWDLALPRSKIVALDIGDVTIATGELSVHLDNRVLTHPAASSSRWADLCPSAATRSWLNALADAGIATGPLFRPVDRHDHIAEQGQRHCGHRPSDCRLQPKALHRIWAVHVVAAGIPTCTPHSLRLGGARDDISHGAPAEQVMRRGGWSLQTDSALRAITTGIRRGR